MAETLLPSELIAAEYLKQILPLIHQYNIAANPINYAICYEYITGKNATLTKAFSLLLQEGKPFTQAVSLEFYGKYICNASLESFENLNHQFQKVIDQATCAISDTYNRAEETNDNFQKKSTLLENLSETVDIRVLLREIIQETQSLALTSQTMQTKLQGAGHEIEQLRSELSQMQRIAKTDGLTGLLNRRAFDQTLEHLVDQEVSEAPVYGYRSIQRYQ